MVMWWHHHATTIPPGFQVPWAMPPQPWTSSYITVFFSLKTTYWIVLRKATHWVIWTWAPEWWIGEGGRNQNIFHSSGFQNTEGLLREISFIIVMPPDTHQWFSKVKTTRYQQHIGHCGQTALIKAHSNDWYIQMPVQRKEESSMNLDHSDSKGDEWITVV